jgi:hypothetical protein
MILTLIIAFVVFGLGTLAGTTHYYQFISNALGGGGNAGGSTGGLNNSKSITDKTSTTTKRSSTVGLNKTSQSISAGVLKILVSPGQSNPFLNAGIGNLTPGASATRSFVVQNTGSTPVTSISYVVSASGNSALQQSIDLQLQQCSTTCTTVLPSTAVGSLTAPVVIYHGSLAPGKTLSFNETTTMANNTPQSAEGQAISLSYSITAVGG